MVWRLGWTLPLGNGPVPVICWVILSVVEVGGLFELGVFLYEYIKKEEVSLPSINKDDYPDVDAFIFTINEPEDVLERTIYACKKMKYPDPGKVHIYLCDDGSRDSMQQLSERMGIHYLSRTVHNDAKAGNFNHALIKSKSPLIAIFDADMMPKANFLLKTVPYFAADKKVGFVQTPQHFYQKDIFQHALPKKNVQYNEQDYFYQIIQQTRNSSNSVILAGSNTMLRRSAIEEIGGLVTGTLTEDFATGIELQKHGYTGISINEVLADGLPPMDFEGLVKQRRRWAKGCIQSGKKTRYLRGKDLTLRQKLNYFSSIIYWYSSLKRLIYMVSPLLFCLAGIGVMRCEPWQIALFWFPLYACINLCVYRFSDGIRSIYWTNIYETVLMPFLLPSVFKEMFGFHQKNFEVTAKKKAAKNNKKTAAYLAPFIVLLALNAAALVMILYRSYIEAAYHYVLLIVYLLLNCHYLLISCKVITGSSAEMENVRFDIREPLQYKDCAEEEFVTVSVLEMQEDSVRTSTYDEDWTRGLLRMPPDAGRSACFEIPVTYEKGGLWKLDAEAASSQDHQEYIYYLFNR